ETCIGIVADCDGSTDEIYAPSPHDGRPVGCPRTGASSCVGGTVQSNCTPGTPAPNDATCNGIDDDCDGSTDENYASVPTNCGVGACARTGATSCVGGSVQNSCVPGTPAPNDATCNGIDDDCDGSTDENYASLPTNCGIGACARTGGSVCVGGSVQSSCAPGTPAPIDARCYGVDDDCDGSTDENYVSTPTACGVGACARTGALVCTGGTVVNTCTPGTPASND